MQEVWPILMQIIQYKLQVGPPKSTYTSTNNTIQVYPAKSICTNADTVIQYTTGIFSKIHLL